MIPYILSCEHYGSTTLGVEFDAPVSKGDTIQIGGIRAKVGEVVHSKHGSYLCLIPHQDLRAYHSDDTYERCYKQVHELIELYRLEATKKDPW